MLGVEYICAYRLGQESWVALRKHSIILSATNRMIEQELLLLTRKADVRALMHASVHWHYPVLQADNNDLREIAVWPLEPGSSQYNLIQ